MVLRVRVLRFRVLTRVYSEPGGNETLSLKMPEKPKRAFAEKR